MTVLLVICYQFRLRTRRCVSLLSLARDARYGLTEVFSHIMYDILQMYLKGMKTWINLSCLWIFPMFSNQQYWSALFVYRHTRCLSRLFHTHSACGVTVYACFRFAFVWLRVPPSSCFKSHWLRMLRVDIFFRLWRSLLFCVQCAYLAIHVSLVPQRSRAPAEHYLK